MAERTIEKLVVFGASNAGGWSVAHEVDYHCSNLLQAVIEGNQIVKITDQEIEIDLTKEPELSDGGVVINTGFPGDTVVDLDERFERDVLSEHPSHLFIWPGLNDISQFVQELPDVEDQAKLNQTLRQTSRFIAGKIAGMAQQAKDMGIVTIIGTIPPYTNRLSHFEEEPEGAALVRIGLPLLDQVNQRLRNFNGQFIISDIHPGLVNTQTGLSKVEFSYGDDTKTGDVLHLNNRGQMVAAAILTNTLLKKTVTIIPANGQPIRWPQAA